MSFRSGKRKAPADIKIYTSNGVAMKAVTKAMEQMNLPSLLKIMQEFERRNEKMELTSEVMAETIGDAFQGDELLDEIGIDTNNELVSAPSATIASPAAKNKLPQAEATPESNRSIMSFRSGKRKAPAVDKSG